MHPLDEIKLPPTPIGTDRDFERLALAGSELSRGCSGWVFVVVGLVSLPGWGIPIGLLATLGGWFRVMALRKIVAASGPPSKVAVGCWAWLLVAALWSVAGIGVSIALIATSMNVDIGWSLVARDVWRLLGIVEMLVAIGWICHEALQRRSAWIVIVMALAVVCLTACVAAQILRGQSQVDSQSQPLLFLLFLTVIFGGGVTSVLLIADAANRLVQSIATDTLDQETL